MIPTLDGFCCTVIKEKEHPRDLSPPAIARRFVSYFELSAFPRFDELVQLVTAAGIGTVVETDMPDFRGVHGSMDDKGHIIHYLAEDGQGAREHTILHETYEIVRERIASLYPRHRCPSAEWMCRHANRFAASVLMQPQIFSAFAETTGFDLVTLHRLYAPRAYSSLTLRLAEVMTHQPLLATLYERREVKDDPSACRRVPTSERFRASVVARTPGFRVRTTRRPLSTLRGLLPRRGSPPASGSVVDGVVRTGISIFVERVSGYDLWGINDLTVVARPVTWTGRIAKVSLVAVPRTDRSILAPQLASANFLRIPKAHQII